ncbi:MAG: DUF3108 domain-containing protein [Alphaproteobacteria bacterium]|nr:DUF3108 domain-containing protein [Alphaproteobacteria bacterium]
MWNRFAILITAVTLFAVAPPAVAQPAAAADHALKLGYSVYLGGLNIFRLDVDLTRDGAGYVISGGGKTQGMIRVVWKWAVTATARGEVKGNGVVSRSYHVTTFKKQKRRSLRLSFPPSGGYSIERTPPDSPRKAKRRAKRMPKSIPAGTIDPVSVTMAVAEAAARGRGCGGRFPVFDGNRRYDVTFTKAGEEYLNKPGFSTFSGHAIRCTLAMKRISGFRKKPVMLRFWDEEKTEAPEIWLAKLNNTLPLVPVKFQADFNLGYMIVYLVKAEYRGRSLLAAGAGKRK